MVPVYSQENKIIYVTTFRATNLWVIIYEATTSKVTFSKQTILLKANYTSINVTPTHNHYIYIHSLYSHSH